MGEHSRLHRKPREDRDQPRRQPTSTLTIPQAQSLAHDRNELLLRRRAHWQTVGAQARDAAIYKAFREGDARPFNPRHAGRAFSSRKIRRQVGRESPLTALNESLEGARIRLHPTKGWRFGSCA